MSCVLASVSEDDERLAKLRDMESSESCDPAPAILEPMAIGEVCSSTSNLFGTEKAENFSWWNAICFPSPLEKGPLAKQKGQICRESSNVDSASSARLST